MKFNFATLFMLRKVQREDLKINFLSVKIWCYFSIFNKFFRSLYFNKIYSEIINQAKINSYYLNIKMIHKKPITIIFLLLALSHFSNTKLTTHFQRYNEENYLEQLKNRQDQFNNQMTDIQAQVTVLDQIISKSEGNDTYQTMKLQEGLADQRDSLYNVQQTLNQPFALKPCQQPKLTPQQKTQLTSQIKLINQSLADMKAEVKKCTDAPLDCTVPDSLIHQITRSEQYLNVMDAYVNGDCNRKLKSIPNQDATGLVDLSDRLYKDNLQAPNWVYGNITEQDYRLIVFAQTTKFNSTTCPLQTPFANKINNTCFNCPNQTIFSVGERICKCQDGYAFNINTNLCESLTPIKPCNQTGSCVSMCPKDKPHWNQINKLCEQCPQDKPIVNRQKNVCESCPIEKPFWNTLTYQCETCQNNTFYIKQSKKCLQCKDQQIYDSKTMSCIAKCKKWQTFDPKTKLCFCQEDINKCKCNQRYNQTLKVCQDFCTLNQQWLCDQQKCGTPGIPPSNDSCQYYQRKSVQTGKCQNMCNKSIARYDRTLHVCIKIGCNIQCSCTQIFDNITRRCIPQSSKCPKGLFFNITSGKCQISCNQGEQYNNETKVCQKITQQKCPEAQTYDLILKKCVLNYIDPTPTPNITLQCSEDQYYDSTSKKCLKRCLLQNNQFYDYATKSCKCIQNYTLINNKCVSSKTICQSSNGEYFDDTTQKCECLNGYYQDPNVTNKAACLSIQTACKNTQNANYNKQTLLCECNDGFYLDQINNKCLQNKISCDSTKKLVYNAQANQCQCRKGYSFNLDLNECLLLCKPSTFTIFDSKTSKCKCVPQYYFPLQNSTYCLPLSSKCISANNMFYNKQMQSCECMKGYYFSDNKTYCISEASKCLTNNNQFYDAVKKTCQCYPEYYRDYSKNVCVSYASKCIDSLHLIYNAATKSCDCEPGYYYSSDNITCLAIASTCLIQKNLVYNPLSLSCQCQSGFKSTFSSGVLLCQSICLVDEQYNIQTQKCIKLCPQGYYYDLNTHSCVYKCQNNAVYNYTTQKCQAIIQTCADPVHQYYDAASGYCKSCPDGYQFNTYTSVCQKFDKKCADGQYYNPVSDLCMYCKQNQIFNNSTKKCQFTSTTCPQSQYFDFIDGICKSCGVGSTYDEYLLTCRTSCLIDQKFDYGTKQCIFISSTCSSLQYYDSIAHQCVAKPICSSVQVYNQNTHQCVGITYITSKNANNLISRNITEYANRYDSLKAANYYLRDCETPTPYYSQQIKKCVYCPESNPYFNLDTNKCQDCGQSTYDVTTKNCKPLQNDTPIIDYSLDRLVMNII